MNLNINIWRVGIWLLFILLGFTAYFRSIDQKLIGYLFLFTPYAVLILAGQPRFQRVKAPLRILRKDALRNLSFYLFLLLLILASFRSTWTEYHSYARFGAQVLFLIIFSVFIRNYIVDIARQGRINLLWKDLLIGLTICVVVNLVARFVLNVEGPQAAGYIEQPPSRISFLPYRIHFPFVPSTREFSYFAGMLFLISGYILLDKHLFRGPFFRLVLSAILLGLALAVITLTDSRMTLIMSLFFYFLLYLFRWQQPQGILAYSLAGVFALFPLVYFRIISSTDLIPMDFFDFTLTGRVYLWAAAAANLFQTGIVPLLIGFGMWSQTIVGLSDSFAVLFQNYVETDAIPYHNATLQLIFDHGFLGFGIYIGLIVTFVSGFLSILKTDPRSALTVSHIMALTVFIYFLGLGITESLTPLYYESHLVILLIMKAYIDTQGEDTRLLSPDPATG